MSRRYLICACSILYERRVVTLPRHERGSFVCACGRELAAWNGIHAMLYRPIAEPSETALAQARRLRTA